MSIVVTGGTGLIGRYLLPLLQEQAPRVQVLVHRRMSTAAVPYRCVVGSFEDMESLKPLLWGGERLFLNGPVTDRLAEQHTRVIDLARQAGVGWIVRISTVGADPTAVVRGDRLHGVVDRYLASSGVPYLILRPSLTMQGVLAEAQVAGQQAWVYGVYGHQRHGFIDCADVAACAALALQRPAAVPANESLHLSGAGAFTYAEVVAALSTRLGRSIQYLDISLVDFADRMIRKGVPPALAERMERVLRVVAKGDGGALTEHVQRLLGRPPRSLQVCDLDAFSEIQFSSGRQRGPTSHVGWHSTLSSG